MFPLMRLSQRLENTMDPNATLLQIREAVTNNDFETAAQLFDGLDHWLTCGGFLPSSWARDLHGACGVPGCTDCT